MRSATAPSRDAACWTVSGVDWRLSRQSFVTPECAATIETHSLDCRAARGPWSILVVVEHWWGPGRVALKSAVWARQLSGSRAAVIAWCEAQARRVAAGSAAP